MSHEYLKKRGRGSEGACLDLKSVAGIVGGIVGAKMLGRSKKGGLHIGGLIVGFLGRK